MLPYDQYQAVIFRDGLASTDPTLGMNAVNQPLDRNLMATNVQQGIAPLYNEMVNPNFYENMYQAPPMNLEQKKQVFNNNLQNKKQNMGIKNFVTNLMKFSPVSNILQGIAAANPFANRTYLGQNDPQGTLDTTISPRIMNKAPTDRDTQMGGGGIPTQQRDPISSYDYNQASTARRTGANVTTAPRKSVSSKSYESASKSRKGK